MLLAVRRWLRSERLETTRPPVSEAGPELAHRPATAEQRQLPGPPDRVGVDPVLVEDPGAPEHLGHQHRPDPGGAVVGLQRESPAVGERDGIAGLGAGLADRPGRAASSVSSSRLVPETYAGCCRIASATRRERSSGLSLPSSPSASRRNARARPTSEVESSGAPQPSTAVHLDRLAGHLRERVGNGPLQRVLGVEVGSGVPAVEHAGGEHRRVLAGAVHEDGGLLPPARISSLRASSSRG